VSIERVFLAIFLSSLLGFGGLGSLPVLRSQLSAAGLPSDTIVLHALAVGNVSPGPNGLYLVAVGYFVGGVPGALAASAAIVLPPILVVVLDHIRTRLIHLRRFQAALQSLSLAVVALLATSSGTLTLHAAQTPLVLTMVVAGAVLLLCRVPPLAGVALAVLVGLAVNLVVGVG
jgi:chromate transporter